MKFVVVSIHTLSCVVEVYLELLHKSLTGSYDEVFGLFHLSLQLVNAHSVQHVKGCDGISHGLDFGVVLRETVDGI